jgi:hypothetical protein
MAIATRPVLTTSRLVTEILFNYRTRLLLCWDIPLLLTPVSFAYKTNVIPALTGISVESFKPTSSRIHLGVYTLISVSTNILPFILQASGSILEANAIRTGSDPRTGTHWTIAGLVFQIFTMLLFGLLCFEFGIRAHLVPQFFDPSTQRIRSLKRFQYFWVALAYAYFLTMIRCFYRVVELSGGIDGRLAQNETTFIALEGVSVSNCRLIGRDKADFFLQVMPCPSPIQALSLNRYRRTMKRWRLTMRRPLCEKL